jgi:hypothetical protein
VREGDALALVDEPTQRREGMYMIGQVAALRDGVVSMAELHLDISEGSSAHLAQAGEQAAATSPGADATPRSPRPRVAIVGMAAILPGAPDLDRYWKNVLGNVDSVGPVPAERWNVDVYYDAKGTGEKTPSKWGGFLPKIAFDPAKYGIPPRSLAAIEPVQLLSLEVARRALADAGYADRPCAPASSSAPRRAPTCRRRRASARSTPGSSASCPRSSSARCPS